jgi:hypothetical protein
MIVIFVKFVVSFGGNHCDYSPRGAEEPRYATGLTKLLFNFSWIRVI